MSERVKSNEEIRARPDEVRETLARARAAFERIDGVISVGFGQKETDGAYRPDLAIAVIVREKRPLEELAPQHRIPAVFEGYRTDVVVLKDGDVAICDNNTEYDIIQGGIQITPTIKRTTGRFGKGTLGCIVHRRGDNTRDNVYLLTCKHVLFDGGAGPGENVYHPFPARAKNAGPAGPSTALGPTQQVAFYENVGYTPPGSTVPSQFFLDCATARINIDCKCWFTRCTKDDIKFDSTIVDLELGGDDPNTPRREDNTIADVRNVIDDLSIIGEKVFKVGRTTGKTRGIVRRINGSSNVLKDFNDENSGRMFAVNLIEIDYDTTSPDGAVNCVGNQRFVETGDSGSIVVDDQRRAIGILSIGASRISDESPPPRAAPAFACHIMPVLDRLGICIATHGGSSRGSCSAMDGTGKTPVRPTQAEIPPDGEIHPTRRTATPDPWDFPQPIEITAAENDRMLALRDQLLEVAYGAELYEAFVEIRREIGYLVRNVRPVKVAWQRQRGPAFFVHLLHHLKGDTDSLPHVVEGVSRGVFLARMGELLGAHGSHQLRAAIERHGPILLPILSRVDTVHDGLAALRALAPDELPEVTGVTPPSDSLGQVSIQLARLLDPLRTELTPENAQNFFAEIGITVSDTQATALATPLSSVVGHTEDLVALVPEIMAALTAEDYATAIEKGLQASVKIGQVIEALAALASAAQGMGIPDAGTIAQRVFDFLLANYLDDAQGLNDALEFIGLLEREDVDADPPFTIHTYDFGAIGEWLSDPAAKAEALYGWGSGFDGQLLFPRLERLLAMQGLPVLYHNSASPRLLDAVFIEIVPAASGAPGIIIRLKNDIALGEQTIEIGRDATLELDAQFETPFDTEIAIRTDGSIAFTPPTASSFSGTLSAKVILRREEPPDPFVIFGQAGGSRLEFRDFTVTLVTSLATNGGSASGDLDLSGALNGGKVVIDATDGDGFLGKILPGTHVEADFDVFMGISTERGFYFGGSSALEVRLPVHIELGPIAIEAITLGAGIDNGNIPFSVGADIRAQLGPIVAVVQNMGVTATLSFPPNNSGNLGPAQLDIGFKPPTGVGLRIDAGPISGGGFLSIDNEKGEYIGALELSFEGVFSLKAIGIINTKMPDGSKGFALLILITAEFTPIQLGYGFTLLGVGGLLGLNRSLDTEALRVGVRTGAVSSVLFPPDVIGNIVQIVSDLKAFFPIVQGHFIVAPMGKLGWGTPTLISLELGIILDIPSPQLTIIGVLRCILPEQSAPILKLQVNFAGGVDFQRGLIWFDASLFDSSLLAFVLTGDMAVRVSWGDQDLLVLTVGGFHPAFDEVPSDLTGMKRIGIALLSGNNPRLFAQAYFAVTSNTVQSGARVELYASASGFNIYGFVGYDLLIHFDPFHFVADIEAGLALRRGSSVICGIKVTGQLSGPTPWHARGRASISFFFFSVSVGFDETWGDDAPALPADTADVLDLVATAVRDVRNWRAELPSNTTQTVSLRKVDAPTGSVLLHPFGVLVVSQKVAPFELTIDKFGNKKPVGDTTFTIATSSSAPSDEERDEFAVANFVSMSDSEKLARKSFEKLKSGLRLTGDAGAATGSSVPKDVTYEMSYLNRKQPKPAGKFGILKGLFDIFSRGAAATRTPLSVGTRKRGGNGPAVVDVNASEWQVVNVTDLSPVSGVATARTQTEAMAQRDALIRENPSLAGTVQVVAAHELFVEDAA